MATKLSQAGNATVDIDAGAAADAVELDGDSEAEPPATPTPTPTPVKDPMIRRKIEDKLERIRLREELGIYDEDQWKDL